MKNEKARMRELLAPRAVTTSRVAMMAREALAKLDFSALDWLRRYGLMRVRIAM